MIDVVETLTSLGDTPGKVAETLRTAGIKGRRGWAKSCPVACYLKSKAVIEPVVGITSFSYLVGKKGESTRESLPRACGQFVEAFDNGEYSDLEGSC